MATVATNVGEILCIFYFLIIDISWKIQLQSLCLSVSFPVSLCLSLSLMPSLSIIHLCLCLSVSMSLCLSICSPSVCQTFTCCSLSVDWEDIWHGISLIYLLFSLGTGKTHTMLGTDDDPGIMVRALNDLFLEMERTQDKLIYKVTMSYLEVSCSIIQSSFIYLIVTLFTFIKKH